MTRMLALVGALAVVAGPAGADDTTRKAGAPSALAGTYTIVSGERDGKKIPDDEIKGATVTFGKGKVTGMDKDRKEFFAATYTVDVSPLPNRIDMVSVSPKAGEKASGVIEIAGDTVKICYNLPGGDVPKDFTTREKQQCFVLKRTKAAGDK
jgi:uncharacterized protein (TIGR03067 family)